MAGIYEQYLRVYTALCTTVRVILLFKDNAEDLDGTIKAHRFKRDEAKSK